MAMTEKELNADGHLEKLLQIPSVEGYVVFNADGIPMRYDKVIINHKRAVHIAALFSDYFRVCKKIFGVDLKVFNSSLPLGNGTNHKANTHSEKHGQSAGEEVELVRMRTTKQREFIMTFHGDFYIVCIQKFTEEKEDKEDSESRAEDNDDGYGLGGLH